MNIAVAFTYSANAKTTKLATLSVKRVPAGSTVTVACPKSCAKKRFVKTNAKGTVSLKSLLTKPLKVNQTITITVAKAGYVTTIKTVKMRARKAPSITTRCVPAGEC